jgi:ferredoxin
MKRVDERDVIFSRMGYEEGQEQYKEYYNRHPKRKELDDELRAKLPLCSKGTPTYHPLLSAAVDANFMFLSDIKHLCEGEPASEKIDVDKKEVTSLLKNLGVHYGALEVKMCKAEKNNFYLFRGRHPEVYGANVDLSLRNVIIFTVKMEQEFINTAPQMSACSEASKAYVEAAKVGMQLSYLIRNLGYNARCHMDGNYLLRGAPLAVDAGLGQIGRNGLIISGENGCFVRLGFITTDMDLEFDEKVDYDIPRFCKLCKMCIRTCPAKTITESDNAEDWKIDQQKCYSVWRNIGTDCGVCLSACPIGQGISAKEIKEKSDKELVSYLNKYKEKNGVRKYRKDKYFL